ncbi:MAG TPA: NHLP leader peptide family RiPP precursor [Pedobacter sp.]
MQLTEQNFYGTIVQKAWDDPQFKSALISSPVETLEQFTGQKSTLPRDQKLVVVDQTDDSTMYFNIPRKVDTESLELTDEQLETVAGGTDVLFWGGIGIGMGLAAAFLAGQDAN